VREGIEELPSHCAKVLFEEELRDGRWIRISLSRTTAASRFATGFLEDITQLKETQAASARRSEIIEGLSAEYFILYNVDLTQDRIEPYLARTEVAAYFAKVIEGGMAYGDWLEDYCANYVAREHKAEVFAHLNPEALRRYAEGGPGAPADLSVVFKRLFGSEEQFIELRVIKTGEGARGVVLAARNINDEVQKKMDQSEALETALAVAKHANESKTTFLTNISHDLRTPLNSIMGYCDLALAHLDDSDSMVSSLEKIRLSSNHLLNLINDILDVNRIEGGKMVLSEQAIDLVQLVAEVRDVFAGQAKEKGIADAILVGDEAKIREIAGGMNMDLTGFEIIDEPDHVQAAHTAVKLVHDGKADMYMKGLIDTKSFLKSVLDKEVGLRTGKALSHVCVFEVEGIDHLLFLSDVAFMTYPTLEDKVHIIENTVDVCHACGIPNPKVAPLAAVEVVNPKMPVTFKNHCIIFLLSVMCSTYRLYCLFCVCDRASFHSQPV